MYAKYLRKRYNGGNGKPRPVLADCPEASPGGGARTLTAGRASAAGARTAGGGRTRPHGGRGRIPPRAVIGAAADEPIPFVPRLAEGLSRRVEPSIEDGNS